MSGRMNMPKRGRTGRGKAAPLDSLYHYLRKFFNRLDGASQRERKAMLEALGFEREEDPSKDEVIERVKIGAKSFEDLVKLAGGEKMPGCGAIVPFAVGLRDPVELCGPKLKNTAVTVERSEDATVELTEAEALERMAGLQTDNYYQTDREEGREGKKRRWPGFVQATVTMSPGDSRALVAAVKAGALSPEQFRERLRELTHQAAAKFRETTKIGSAKRGLEPVLCAWHLEQGCLHFHIWSSDIDVHDAQRVRLGLFATEGKEDGKPRLTLNSLGVSGVAMRRHKAAGHAAGVRLLKDGRVCEDYKLLEVAEAHRAAKGLGPCWDAELADEADKFWADAFADAKLARFRIQGFKEWDKEWRAKRSGQLKKLQKMAADVVPELQAVADRAAERVASEKAATAEEKKRLAERERDLERLAVAAREQADEAAKAKAEAERVKAEASEQLAAERKANAGERMANAELLEHAVRPWLAKNLTDVEGGAEDARQGRVPARAGRCFEPLAGARHKQYVLVASARAYIAAGRALKDVGARCRRLIDLDDSLRMEPEFDRNVVRFEEAPPKRGAEIGG